MAVDINRQYFCIIIISSMLSEFSVTDLNP